MDDYIELEVSIVASSTLEKMQMPIHHWNPYHCGVMVLNNFAPRGFEVCDPKKLQTPHTIPGTRWDPSLSIWLTKENNDNCIFKFQNRSRVAQDIGGQNKDSFF